ncbi:hypothetical protein ZIOFF_050195 [Zingiber officinale]|uniref:VQ domain-containing protein n=1 Tax=Zingiber officinale TaxID=94328 RepID=A0A8J5FGF3_ZINOF|nr:hypothetical protein ZIOFF_050195 [Zingiber officinale]
MEKPPAPPSTTFVQADAATFKELVQRLTGPDWPPHRSPPRNSQAAVDAAKLSGVKRLHERRRVGGGSRFNVAVPKPASPSVPSPASGFSRLDIWKEEEAAEGGDEEVIVIDEEEEERAIKERRFYLHPSPRGAEPKQLALSTALGITLGVFPICGTTVFLCGLAIGLVGKHCHAPTLMLANFVATPIELSYIHIGSVLCLLIGAILSSLIVPFLWLGELISGGHHFPLTTDALKKVITGQASKVIPVSILHALLGWIIAAPFILAASYTLLVPCFKLLVHRFSPRPSSPKIQLYPLTDPIMPKRST